MIIYRFKSWDCSEFVEFVELGVEKMENSICIKCGEESKNGLPLCYQCRVSLNDFRSLVQYLEAFTGRKDDLLYIIDSEIANRSAIVISQCKVDMHFEEGTIVIEPIKPSGSIVKSKPWLWEKYNRIRKTLDEITKLRRARGIVIKHYQGA